MKELIQQYLSKSLVALREKEFASLELPTPIQVERTKDSGHGDFATNLALILAKSLKLSPREVAQKIINYLPPMPEVTKVEMAGPGFINFFVQTALLQQIVTTVLNNPHYGHSTIGNGRKIHMEYVSANPTGPLHVGHGRGAAYGACVANLLRAAGFLVHREYYVNDAGRQMRILAVSVWIRYLQKQGESVTLPPNGYRGDYIVDIAEQLIKADGKRFYRQKNQIEFLLPENLNSEEDKEKYMDAWIDAATQLLGKQDFDSILQVAVDSILTDIRDDLAEFGVEYDEWFKESELFKNGLIEKGLAQLEAHGYVYEKDGAKWFRSTNFGDEKDRVLIRDNGHPTYFASDVAYHLYKYEQGYDHIIDIFGADHHGFIARIRGFLQGLKKNPDQLTVLLVQFAVLYRGTEKVQMSTRSGEFITLRELRKEVGNDAARFFYIIRKPEQHLDFDLELAKSQSSENPVYYIQYAHARISSVFRQLAEQNLNFDLSQGLKHLDLLISEHEKAVCATLSRYPELITNAANNYAPHLLAHYLQELANQFHVYYNSTKFLVDDASLRCARLCLIKAVKQVIAHGLSLLGVCAPETM